MKKETIPAAIRALEIEEKAVRDMRPVLDMPAFAEAVEAIATAPMVITSASGSSGIAAHKMAHTLCCVERPAHFLTPAEALHGGLGFIQKGDVVVLLSRGGKTGELLPVLDVAKIKGAKIIGITENMNSPIAQDADIVLPMIIEKEADKYNVQATASFVASIGLIDALICAVMEERDYQKEQFALIHPGGAVGERLNKK